MDKNKNDKKKELLERIKKGVENIKDFENFKKWLKVQALFYRYSFGNTVLIWLQKPNATRVAGFKTWQKMERRIKKGEKGIAIFAPIIVKKKRNDDCDSDLQLELDELKLFDDNELELKVEKASEKEEEEKVLVGFKITYVWDISQTTGKPLPEICQDIQGEVDEAYLDALVSVAESHDITVEFVFSEDWPFGSAKAVWQPSSRSISIKKSFSLQEFSNLVHELAHALDTRKEPKREEKEIMAESCSFIVCEHFGFDTSTFSFEYLASWSDEKDLSDFQKSLELAQKLSSYLIGMLEKEIEKRKGKKAA